MSEYPYLEQLLQSHAPAIKQIVAAAGGSDVRVFGSVATGTATSTSDIDLLFRMGPTLGLMELASLERRVEELLGVPVDLVTESELRQELRERVLAESRPL